MKSTYGIIAFFFALLVAQTIGAQTISLPNTGNSMNLIRVSAPQKLPKTGFTGTARLTTADGKLVSSAMVVFFIGNEARGTQKLIAWTDSRGMATVTLPGFGQTGASSMYIQAVSSSTAGNASAISEPIKLVR